MLLHALLLAILPLSLAKTITVDVGKGGLVFTPNNVTAAKGDSIVFTFYPENHTVVESTFDKPCNYKSGGIFSGSGFSTTNGASSKTFTVNIDNTDTRWLYCSINGHCQKGMSFVINQGDQTLNDYQKASLTATGTNDPSSVSGGAVSSSGSSSVTAKASSATSASASSASSSSGTAASITSSSASKASATSASATSTGAASKVGAGAALGIAGMLLGGLI